MPAATKVPQTEQPGVTLALLRREAGLNQTEVAEAMQARCADYKGWRQVTVSRIESGARAITLGEAFDLALIVGGPDAARRLVGARGVGAALVRVRAATRVQRDAVARCRARAGAMEADLLRAAMALPDVPAAIIATQGAEGAKVAWAEYDASLAELGEVAGQLGSIASRASAGDPASAHSQP